MVIPVVLASASPRRAEVLAMLGIPFTVAPAGVEERMHPAESPRRYVERLAREKAAAVAAAHPGALIVAGDTIVVLGGRVLEKPADPADAAAMLAALSARAHTVYSGLALARGKTVATGVAVARVVFHELGRDLIDRYVETGEPLDKAGAYGIQGYGSALVREIEGDYFTVVGLSVAAFVTLLPELGLEYRPGEGVVGR
ncbi:MAG: Maf family nucleotide pyrophosphatase [Gemmatimonadota bacterium]|nr:Maf family nucleotide pyrophosphatase [Gemmatimonadota bacterium]MDE2676820.1 Maf family nucleotide pyrophosphatase [Gemmatimonadota bacterium]